MVFDIDDVLGASESMSQMTSVAPLFLCKVWQLVNDETNDKLVSWSFSGNSFIIHDPAKFAKQVLPNYFKHQRVDSFIRQLNMYGFRKVQSLDSGALKSTIDAVEYSNENFIKGRADLLEHIKRKDNKRQLAIPENPVQNKQLSVLLSELSNQQMFTNNEFENLRLENETLINKIEALQSKHDKQQETVTRLINFTISFMKNNGSLEMANKILPNGIKRKAPPMIFNSAKRMQIQECTEQSYEDNSLEGEINLNNTAQMQSNDNRQTQSDVYFHNDQNDCNALLPSSGNPMAVMNSEDPNEFINLEFSPAETTPMIKSTKTVNKLDRSLNKQHNTLRSIMRLMDDATR